jgi:outer membrane murein-binding lipoprotein Lpp
MPKKLRPLILALMMAAVAAGVAGCGDSGPAPSIPADDAQTLDAKIQEIEANVQVGSCLVAQTKTDDLIADVQDLPSSVDSDVRRALESGANNLKLLLSDPSQCATRTTSTTTPSTTESTTESTTTTKTRPSTTTSRTQTQPTTTTQTQTTPTTPSGGVGPGSPGGL